MTFNEMICLSFLCMCVQLFYNFILPLIFLLQVNEIRNILNA